MAHGGGGYVVGTADGKEVTAPLAFDQPRQILEAVTRRMADDLVQALRVHVAVSADGGEAYNKANAVIRATLDFGPVLTVECVDRATGYAMWRKATPLTPAALPELGKSKVWEEALQAIVDRVKHADRSATPGKASDVPRKRPDPDVLAILPPTLPDGLGEAAQKALQPLPDTVADRLLKEGKMRLVPPGRAAAHAASTPADAGRELGAGVVLAFDIAASADKKSFTLTGSLTEAETGLLLWRDRWSADLEGKELPTFLARTASSVAEGVRKRLAR